MDATAFAAAASARAEAVAHKASQVRNAVPQRLRRRSTAVGVILFFVTFAVFSAFAAAAASAVWWPARAAISFCCGLVIALCFIVAHDACHGSLTPRPLLNKIIARIAFCPSLHPYSSWEWSHNALHHGMTNVRGADVVFVPKTADEFRQMHPFRRLAERFFRSPPGFGAYYFCTIWLPHEMFPPKSHLPPGRGARRFQLDRLLVLAFLACWVAAVVAIGAAGGSVALSLLFAVLIPLVVFHWLMGAVSFLHHTHPRSPWYAGPEEHTFFGSQVRSTVHMEMPPIVELILCNILQHTAHHADPRIPLYQLGKSQECLKRAYPEHIISEPWSLRGFRKILRTCRLYDYTQHRWLDYDGTPLTEPHFIHPREGGNETAAAPPQEGAMPVHGAALAEGGV